MNALQAMVKATARVRRDGSEAEIPAEEVVVGDVVLLAAGDEVPADGRIIEASALQIDESALTGESVPASKGVETPAGTDLAPGDQTDMAFMHTPVTHGSGVMIVTATGSDTEVGKIAGMLATHDARADAADQAAEHADAVDRRGGRHHDGRDVRARRAARPVRRRSSSRARSRWRSRRSPRRCRPCCRWSCRSAPPSSPGAARCSRTSRSVETLGSTSAINSDKTGTLTMNQMTAVEVVDPTDRYTISGSGYELEGKVQHAAGSSRHDRRRDPALRRRQRRQARRRQGRRRPDRGRAARARAQGGPRHRGHPRAPPAAGDAAVRSDLQADGGVHRDVGRRAEVVRCLRQGRGARRHEPRSERALGRAERSRGTTDLRSRARGRRSSGWARTDCA